MEACILLASLSGCIREVIICYLRETNQFFTVKIPSSVKECAPDVFESGVTVIFDEMHEKKGENRGTTKI